ncbi:unnamed protein product, partial [marine sediment metagenome]
PFVTGSTGKKHPHLPVAYVLNYYSTVGHLAIPQK